METCGGLSRTHHIITGPSQNNKQGARVELNCLDQPLRTRYPPFEPLEPQDHLVQSMSPCWTNRKTFTPKSVCFSLRRVSTEREPTSVTRAFRGRIITKPIPKDTRKWATNHGWTVYPTTGHQRLRLPRRLDRPSPSSPLPLDVHRIPLVAFQWPPVDPWRNSHPRPIIRKR